MEDQDPVNGALSDATWHEVAEAKRGSLGRAPTDVGLVTETMGNPLQIGGLNGTTMPRNGGFNEKITELSGDFPEMLHYGRVDFRVDCMQLL